MNAPHADRTTTPWPHAGFPHHHPQPDAPAFDDWYDSLDEETRAIFDSPPQTKRRDTEPGPEPAF